jgi:tetratricopeptide (TPR) repeat protein
MSAALASSRSRTVLFAALIAIATAVAYQPAWHGGFIWDDDAYITHNPLLTAPDGLRRIWFSLDSPSQYFPLVYTTFRLERALWDLNTTGYHLVNIALHIANALLVWRVLARLAIPGAILAAAIFALHPVHVESVAWITERKNVLMGVFFLLALLSWINFLDAKRAHAWRHYLLALVFYSLALFSKTTACTMPAALLLICWWRRERIDLRRLAAVVPFIFLGIGMGAITVWWERYHQGTRGDLFALGLVERLLVATRAIWFYLAKLVWPAKLTFIYPRWQIGAHDIAAYVWIGACIVAMTVVCVLRKRVGRGPEVAFVYYIATLSPLLGFIMLYTFRYTFVADHYQYLASIGPIVLGSAAIWQLERVRVVVGVLISITLAVLTWKQAHMYSNIEMLWRTTIERNPSSWMAYNNLGIELAQQGRNADALDAYKHTVAMQPNYPEAHYNMANALLATGNPNAAIAEARSAIALNPKEPDAHVALGNALAAAGRYEEAGEEYERASALRPADLDTQYNIGLLLFQMQRADAAIPHFEQVLRRRDDVKARIGLANALLALHRNEEAIAQFSAALRSTPDNLVAQCNLGWALATSADSRLRDGRRALQLATRANVATNGNDPVVLRSLAAAYAELGEFEAAIETAREALQRATQSGNEPLQEALRSEIAAYESHSAFRE